MTNPPAIQRRRFLARALGVLAGALLGKNAPRVAAAATTQNDLPYLGEIRMFAGDFAPLGWAFCNGQLLNIATYNSLFSLIGTTYGGDGQVAFALPDLRSRAPVHLGTGFLGEAAGQEMVTMFAQQIPAHSHTLVGSSALADLNDPAGRVPAKNPLGWPHYGSGIDTSLAANALTATGSTAPHNNMMPSLCINFIICLEGVFPQQS